MKIRYAAISAKGPRPENEDSYRITYNEDNGNWFALIADGLGGHSNGLLCSTLVCDAVSGYYNRSTETDEAVRARKACRAAAAKVDERAYTMNHVQMGSTLVMADISGDLLTITHCGDSRCYFMRDGEFVHQTLDHVDNRGGWEIINRCIFTYKPEAAVPDIAQFRVKSGDRILLCSDGLYKSMAPEILKTHLWNDQSPEELLDTYASLCEKYAEDNYTGILAIIE